MKDDTIYSVEVKLNGVSKAISLYCGKDYENANAIYQYVKPNNKDDEIVFSRIDRRELSVTPLGRKDGR